MHVFSKVFRDERGKTYFSPLTTVFALTSKVRRQRFNSDSCARTALLTDFTTREVAPPLVSPESACTTGKGLAVDVMGRQLKTANVFRVDRACNDAGMTLLVRWGKYEEVNIV